MSTVIGLDVGYGNTKVVWSEPGATGFGPTGEVCFPSLTPPCHLPALEKMEGMGTRDRVVVEVDGQSYFVGREATLADSVRILDPDFIHRPEYLALLAGAFHYYLKATESVAQSIDLLVLGLPVSSFQQRRADLKAIGSKVHRVPLPRSLQARAGRETLDFFAKKVLVVPQPFGGLRLAMDPILSGDNDLFEDDGGLNLVIDPGFSTFDWFLSETMSPQFELCGSFNGGVSQILREVAHAAGLALGIGDLNLVTAERALASGVLNYAARRIDFAPYQAIARAAALSVVDEFLLNFNFQKIAPTRVILAGGGAIHYIDALRKRLPGFDLTAVPDSVMANARGFRLLGQDALAVEQA